MKNTYKIGLTLAALSATAASSFGAVTILIEGNRNEAFTTWTLTGSVANFFQDVDNTPDAFKYPGSDIQLNNYMHIDGRLLNTDAQINGDSGNGNDAFGPASNFNNQLLAANVISGHIQVSGTEFGLRAFEGVSIDTNAIDGTNTFTWYAGGAFPDADPQTFTPATTNFFNLVFEVMIPITQFGVGSDSVGDGFLGTFHLASVPNIDQRPEGLTVTITAVPEPSSTALLGLGGLALLLRRRRA